METELRHQLQIFARNFGFLNKECCHVQGHAISLVQSHILYEIKRQQQPSIQQVAEALGTDITTFSRQIQSLEKMNLVKKTPNADDKRVFILSFTEEGEKVVHVISGQMNQMLHETLSHMTDDEKEMVIKSIQLLNNSMAKTGKCCTIPSSK